MLYHDLLLDDDVLLLVAIEMALVILLLRECSGCCDQGDGKCYQSDLFHSVSSSVAWGLKTTSCLGDTLWF
jgi:uncharacterized protein (DUF779 family)